MALGFDFLTKEILVKIGVKFFGIARTLFLLFFFGISSVLDDFYFANSIVGLILLINILFETTFSRRIFENKNNFQFLKRFHKKLNKLSICLTGFVLIFSVFFIEDKSIIYHIVILALWSIVNINSYYFLLIFRFLTKNKEILRYYFLIAFFGLLFLFVIIYANIFSKENLFIAISLSILLSECVTFLIVFSKYNYEMIKIKQQPGFKIDISNDIMEIFKVLVILILVSLIDVTDKTFLSYLGEGKITYYTYGLYAPLMIRQALDIKSNFFAQINQLNTSKEINKVFFVTLKRIMFFFVIAAITLVILFESLEHIIIVDFELVSKEGYDIIRGIIYIGVIITPFYMIWDLFYRFYYRTDLVNKLLLLTLTGFIINLILNYSFSVLFGLDIYGILVSTLLVFLLYNIISYYVFFRNPNLKISK